MVVTEQDIRSVANAYRAALRSADDVLADSTVEKKMLVAQVASSAQSIRHHLRTRLPDGDRVGEALDTLIPEIQKEDVVGTSLAALSKAAWEEVQKLALAAVGAGTWPVWLGTVGALLASLATFSYDVGQTVGGGIVALVLGGGGAALFGLTRVFAAAGPATAQALGQAHSSLWNVVGSVGVRAEQVFTSAVRPELVKMFGPGEGVRQPPAGHQVRGLLKGIVGLSYTLLAVALLFFGAGLIEALEAYNSAPAVELPSYP